MKILSVHPHVLEHPLDEPFQSSFSGFTARQACLVEIAGEDGVVGWGECLGPAALNAAVVRQMAGLLIGENVFDSERLWLTLYSQMRDQGQRGLVVTALSGIDVALWDLKGKALGVPVATLLGGAFRSEVPAYATGAFRRPAGMRVAYLAEETADYAAEGFRAVKIKIGFDVEEDIAVIAAVRDAIGADVRLMIDANHGYDVLEAVRLGNAVAAYHVDWFEEPVIPEDLDSYGEIRRRQPLPVAAGETWHGRWAFRDALAARAVDIAQPDVCGVGGFSEARRVADLAALHGVRCIPHVWGTGVALAAALQFLAALPPAALRHEPAEPLLEFDRTDNPLRQAVLTAPIEHHDGVVAIPAGPGLGIEINRDALRRFAT